MGPWRCWLLAARLPCTLARLNHGAACAGRGSWPPGPSPAPGRCHLRPREHAVIRSDWHTPAPIPRPRAHLNSVALVLGPRKACGEEVAEGGVGVFERQGEGSRQASHHRVTSWRSQATRGGSSGLVGGGRKATANEMREKKEGRSALEDAVRARLAGTAAVAHSIFCLPLRASRDLKRPPFLDFLFALCSW